MLRGSIVLAALAAGCYAPSFTPDLPCSGSGDCPDGQSCNPITQVCEMGGTAAVFGQLSAGLHHTCGITPDQALYCWGANESSQDGLVGTDQLAPVRVGGDADWIMVDAGVDHTCGIRAPGTLWCWGDDSSAQLGAPGLPSTSPQQVGTANDWIAVTAGLENTCGIRNGGTLWCWGANPYGEAGVGSTASNILIPTQVVANGDPKWLQVSTSLNLHTCGIDDQSALWCWGDDENEQLGDGVGQTNSNTPKRIDAGPWKQVVALARATCALAGDDTLWCWGGNGFTDIEVPTQVDPTQGWKTISESYDQLCGVREDNTAWCMGAGLDGELGVADAIDTPTLTPVVGIGQWHSLTGGAAHTCGILAIDGSTWCWGSNDRGQLGLGHGNAQTSPLSIEESGWTAIATGDRHSCGIRAGEVDCFGANGFGQLGDGTTEQEAARVQAMPDAIAVAAGDEHTCAISTDHALWCWGRNSDGELGTTIESAPILIPTKVGSATWTAVAAAGDHTCGIQSDGSLWCWGGQRTATPTMIQGVTGWTTIAVHASSSYVSGVANGMRYDWPAFDDLTVVPTPLDSSTSYVYGNGSHTCSLHTGNQLLCAGGNEHGELGDGTTNDSVDGIDVIGSWKMDAPGTVGVGVQHTCALHTDGTLACWGANESGELGIGSFAEQHMPMPVALDGAALLAGGGAHTCAITATGALYCWGSDSNGQLGDDVGGSTIPVRVTAP